MEPIAFDSSLELGIPEIDDQHRELVAIYNETRAALDAHDEAGHFVQILNHLTQFAVDHCIAVEELMEEVGFPDLVRRRECHDQSTRLVFEFDPLELMNNVEAAEALMSLVRSWLLNHIQEERELLAFLHVQARRAAGVRLYGE